MNKPNNLFIFNSDMRNFLQQTGLFSLPLLLGVLVIMAYPYDKEFGYRQLDYHCRLGKWLYNRIFINSKPIDIGLIGSSRMMCGLSDYQLEKEIQEKGHWKPKVANLGLCRLGRTLHHSLIQDLIHHKNPSLLLIEVRKREDSHSHFDFPNIADTHDVLFPKVGYHDRYVEQFAIALKNRFHSIRQRILEIPIGGDTIGVHQTHGFIPTGKIIQMKASQIQPSPAPTQQHSEDWLYSYENRVPRTYLNEIHQLAQSKNIRLVFLYLPGFNSHPKQLPLEKAFYEKMGTVWIPPAEIYSNPKHWADPNHLNETGMTELTHWVAKQITDNTNMGKSHTKDQKPSK